MPASEACIRVACHSLWRQNGQEGTGEGEGRGETQEPPREFRVKTAQKTAFWNLEFNFHIQFLLEEISSICKIAEYFLQALH